LTNFSGDQHAWLLYLTIGNIWQDIRQIPIKHSWILIELKPNLLKGGKIIDKTGHCMDETVLSQLRQLDITCPGLKSNCADRFQQQCYFPLATWVAEYLDEGMVI